MIATMPTAASLFCSGKLQKGMSTTGWSKPAGTNGTCVVVASICWHALVVPSTVQLNAWMLAVPAIGAAQEAVRVTKLQS